MRAIIDGDLYDTERSERLGSYGRFSCAKIYKDPVSGFFVATGSRIKVATEEDVRKHLGHHDVDTYIEEFGHPEENDDE